MMAVVGIIFGGLLLIFLIYASANIRSGVYVKTVSRLPTREKKLVLTFDDGPHPEITPLVLEVLKKYQVPAIFFCVGDNIEKYKSIVSRMMKEGHRIGNHTDRHAITFHFYTSSRMKTEINACRDRMIAAGAPDFPRLFRPPFGVTNPALRKALKNTGYKVIGWNIRSLDTINKNPDAVFKRVTKRISPGSILLFHDSQAHTPEVIERIINFALDQGYQFVGIDDYI